MQFYGLSVYKKSVWPRSKLELNVNTSVLMLTLAASKSASMFKQVSLYENSSVREQVNNKHSMKYHELKNERKCLKWPAFVV